MKDYKKKIQLEYAILSKVYDLGMGLVLMPIKSRNPRSALANHIPNENIKVLDVCCGTGCNSIVIAEKNNKNNITGIDLTEGMLMVAKRKTSKKNLTNIKYEQMDATKMEFADNFFDVVTISLGLHEMPLEVSKIALSEIGRVLKPKGKLYIIEWEKPKSKIGSILFSIFPTPFEPKGFRQFLKLDFKSLLRNYGLQISNTEYYNHIKLIIASKQ